MCFMAACVWPRLQSSQEKPHWVRIDFDHWEELSDGEDGDKEGGDGEDSNKKPLTREILAEIKDKQVHRWISLYLLVFTLHSEQDDI